MAESVIIIGSGPAGLSAAIYTAREGFNPLVIAGAVSGGQLMLTTVVENMPGFPDGVQGPEIIELMRKQAERFGARFVNDDVTDVDFSKRPFKVKTAGKEYEAQTVIVATGASSRMLGMPSEAKFIGHGVSTCATCDSPFYKNKDIVVIGGGDTAMEDALFSTRFCKSVTIVHRRDAFRASKIMQDKLMSNPKIKVIWNSEVIEILGDNAVRSIKLKDNTGKVTEMPIDGVFLAIGHVPATGFLKGKLKLDDQGYIVTKEEVLTDIDGVYVAGDNADRFYRQAGTASSSGIKAALRVREYFQKMQK
ncbi:MAG: thioredoxin-disulfide reductase [Candidatus Marsarchaeota archaeon]|jgi:thioredoxin reductase (NADPH)|nr:thioredoxin-disulfide reductase [Candidatus Marsarchaeota archaeon]MCL5111825.1 thioredoxin-disulfide reductase [Candidatus Marsarchaeota archaeon]